MGECLCCVLVSVDFVQKEEKFQGYLCWIWLVMFGLSGTTRIPFALSWYTGPSKFPFDLQVFLKSVDIKYILVHIYAYEVSE